jgi:hypothetical protein
VTRWYIQRQTILDEIAALEAKLAQHALTQEKKQEPGNDNTQIDDALTQQLADAQEKLRSLGPCPKPMMG